MTLWVSFVFILDVYGIYENDEAYRKALAWIKGETTELCTVKRSRDELKKYDGPQCFAIPGNHDWYDGLNTFLRNICRREYLGGWLLPQEKSYFALKLPKNWWIFGVSDINFYFLFFNKHKY